MLLAIDIGNTSITFGLFKGKKLFKVFKVTTALSANSLQRHINKALARHKEEIYSIIICSVVPDKTSLLRKLLKEKLGINANVVGEDLFAPITNLYKSPKQVGQDRLVVAYACKKLYGFPALVIDFGTATTFDYITKDGNYAGGMITPGIEISLDALFKRTALLPEVSIRHILKTRKPDNSLIGKGTQDSIVKGTAKGLTGMCDSLIDKFKKQYGKNVKVVATGGLAEFFKKRCRSIDSVDENLILKGILLMDAGPDYRKICLKTNFP